MNYSFPTNYSTKSQRKKLIKTISTVNGLLLILQISFASLFFVGLPISALSAEDGMCQGDIDVVLIMDRSGSMVTGTCEWYWTSGGYWKTDNDKTEEWCDMRKLPEPYESIFTPNDPTKLESAQLAANTFLDFLGPDDQSALVSFANNAIIDKGLSNDHEDTQDIIDSLTAGGATNIGEAIEKANQELGFANAQSVKVAILLTDGKANMPNGSGAGENPADVAYAEAKAVEAAGLGYKIFTIGLGDDINEVMLGSIASLTGAEYYHSPSPEQLENIYSTISERLCEFSSISGCKWNDINENGSWDETVLDVLPGWEIVLSGDASDSQLTDEFGCYKFSGLEAGTYEISEVLKPGWLQTYPVSGSHNITLDWEEYLTEHHFGNFEISEEEPVCGNAIVEEGEACDSNSEACIIAGYAGVHECNSNCNGWEECTTDEYCGDNIVNGWEVCDDGNTEDNDGCSSTCEEEGIQEGDIVIDEIMQNPAAVSDLIGEWFEVYNTTGQAIDLEGCEIKDNGSNSHVITGSLVVPASGYAVLAKDGNIAQNGGVEADYAYDGTYTLGNGEDEIILICEEVEIDRVEYDGGPGFPDPNGASMILANPFLDNNIGSNWCESSSSFGDGDLGTPGSANDSCSEIPYCGDENLDEGEECDDGNNDSGDGCSADCLIELPGSISGHKYEDGDGDIGTEDWTGLVNWTINLFSEESSTTPIESTVTDENGYFEFSDLLIGDYTLEEVAQENWLPLNPAQIAITVLSGLNSVYNFINHFNAEPYCGDEVCNGEEDCSSCSEDCGGCGGPSPSPSYCGDGSCNGDESCSTCADDCGYCGGGLVINSNIGGSGIPASTGGEVAVLGEEGAPALNITKTVNKEFANPGDKDIEYSISVTNSGNLAAFNVILFDILPAGFTFSDDGTSEKTWQLGDLTSGQTEDLSYIVSIVNSAAPGIYANLVQASADNHDGVSATVDLEVKAAVVLAETGFDTRESILLVIAIIILVSLVVMTKIRYVLEFGPKGAIFYKPITQESLKYYRSKAIAKYKNYIK